MILKDRVENTASCPRLVSSSLLPQTGSDFSVFGDGLAGLGAGLWLFLHFFVWSFGQI